MLNLFSHTIAVIWKIRTTAITQELFKTIQNKLHYSAHGHTASELIYQRADSNKPNVGFRVKTKALKG